VFYLSDTPSPLLCALPPALSEVRVVSGAAVRGFLGVVRDAVVRALAQQPATEPGGFAVALFACESGNRRVDFLALFVVEFEGRHGLESRWVYNVGMIERTAKRRWFRFSLRTLFVAVTVACCILGWRVHRVRQQREAADAILALGGGVFWRGNQEPNMFAEILGMRYPFAAGFKSETVTDDELASIILPLTSLQDLSIGSVPKITDNGLLRLSQLRSLRRLQCIHDSRNRKVVDTVAEDTELSCVECPLRMALEYFSDFHNVRFVLDEQVTTAIQADEMPITRTVSRVPLGDVLDDILAPYKLGWVVKEGAIVITSANVAQQDRRRKLKKKLQAALPNLTEIRVD
jgi:hypothetical protein